MWDQSMLFMKMAKEKKEWVKKMLNYVKGKGSSLWRRKKQQQQHKFDAFFALSLSAFSFALFFSHFLFPFLYLHIWWAADNCYCQRTFKNTSHTHRLYGKKNQKWGHKTLLKPSKRVFFDVPEISVFEYRLLLIKR